MGNSKSTKKLDTSNTPVNEGRKKKPAKAPPLKKPTPTKETAPQPPAPVLKIVAPPKIVQEPVKEEVKAAEVPKVEEPKVVETKVEEPKVVETKVEEPTPAATTLEPSKETTSELTKAAPVVTPVEETKESVPEVEVAKIEETSTPETVTGINTEVTSEEAVKTDEETSHATLASTKMIDLYYFPPSPPSRAVMMTAKAVGVELNLKVTNVMEGATRTDDFMKMNPQHCIPTMDDNGFILWESRAIMGYFVSQYAKDDSLYPTSAQERALVDQRLYFDMGTLFTKMAEYYFPVMFAGGALDPEKLKAMDEALGLLNTFLDGEQFVAGKNLTIADIALVVTVSNIDAFGHDISTYPNIVEWYARTKEALAPCGYVEINEAGAKMLGDFLKSKLG